MSDIKVGEGKGEKKSTDQRVPRASVRGKGRIGRMLDGLAKTYEENNQGRKMRWVYSPLHKPELSNVIGKRADGFVEVTVDDLGESVPGLKGEEVLRVGDVIGMSVPKDLADEMKEELADAAKEAKDSIGREYYEKIREAESGEHKSEPRGAVTIEERQRDYDIEQRTS